ncbi:[weak similarity to] Ion transport 2 domain-containing protein, partial [methanotrophic bacterial endosymbiont of Bathymodiolus sp.]
LASSNISAKRNRFLALLISLVLFFACYPLVENSLLASFILNLFFMLIIFSGVFAISDTREPLFTSLGLAILAVVFRWIHYFYQLDLWLILENTTNTLFWIYIAIHLLKFIFQQPFITADLIYAAIAIYFIFGLAWAGTYQLLKISEPHSFAMSNSTASEQNFIFQMWYFSMVTLTTLGYGDIAPSS